MKFEDIQLVKSEKQSQRPEDQGPASGIDMPCCWPPSAGGDVGGMVVDISDIPFHSSYA